MIFAETPTFRASKSGLRRLFDTSKPHQNEPLSELYNFGFGCQSVIWGGLDRSEAGLVVRWAFGLAPNLILFVIKRQKSKLFFPFISAQKAPKALPGTSEGRQHTQNTHRQR